MTVDGTGTAGMVVSVDGRIATTGPGGVYLIDGVRPGSQSVQVAPPDGGTCSPSARAVTVVAGELVTANFACARPATGSIGGIVTLKGASAVGVTVSAGTRSAVTNAGGVYRIDSVPPGPATVQVGQIDGATCTPSARQVTVVASQIATANFTCTRPTVGTITGTATPGLALERARVAVAQCEMLLAARNGRASTLADEATTVCRDALRALPEGAATPPSLRRQATALRDSAARVTTR